MTFLVVGFDGSDGARAALRFAVDEARLRNAALHAVTAWHVPAAAYGSAMAPPPLTVLLDDLEANARSTLDAAIADVSAGDIEVQGIVREGQAAEVLLDEAKDADLLIVGSRGRGGFKGLLLGSVSAQCAQHARCPVVIVRGEPG